jgi:type I restriction enzyme S subunit
VRYPVVPLSRILSPRAELTTLLDDQEYKRVRVRLHGRGVELRDIVLGADIKTKLQQVCRPGDVIFAEIDAKVGGFGVIPPDLDGAVVSSHYFLFGVDINRVDLGYVGYALQAPSFQEQVAARGSTNYAAIRSHQVLEYEIPLPDLAEQRRVSARLESLRHQTQSIRRRLETAGPDSLTALYPALVDTILQRHAASWRRVDQVARFVSDLVHPGEDPHPAETFVGLQHIQSHTGRRIGELAVGGEKGRKFRFKPGDVVYGYLRPYLNKVWLADRHGLCSVDQYVLRPTGTTGSLLAHALRSRSVVTEAIRLTHNLQLPRLRSGLLARIQVPFVESFHSGKAAVELDNGLARVLKLVALRQEQVANLHALEQSTLIHALNGEL